MNLWSLEKAFGQEGPIRFDTDPEEPEIEGLQPDLRFIATYIEEE